MVTAAPLVPPLDRAEFRRNIPSTPPAAARPDFARAGGEGWDLNTAM
jgi:hypothetical protein